MYIQVVADCFLKSGQKPGPVAPGEVLKALDYFNIPENLWPEGLIAVAAVGTKYDCIANQLMNTIKSDIVALAKDNSTIQTQKQYLVFASIHPHQSESESERGHALILRPYVYNSARNSSPCQLPAALVQRLQHLADVSFLQFRSHSDFHSSSLILTVGILSQDDMQKG